jgi:hypothetical protein
MTDNEHRPFNDASDHLNKIEGYPMKADVSKLPRPLKMFAYFFIAFFILSTIAFVVLAIIL